MPTPRAALALTVTLTLTVGLPGAVAAEPVGASGPPRPSVAVPAPPPSGDFSGDGFADVAIGVPGESVGSASHAGAVHVLYGSASGITSAGNQFWTQNSSNVPKKIVRSWNTPPPIVGTKR